MAGIDSFTKWMLHCDLVTTTANFVDSELAPVKTQTAQGSCHIDTNQSQFGGASGNFNGSTDWVQTATSTDFDFTSGDFTLDFWVRFNSVGECGWISNGVTGSGGFSFNYDGANILFRLATADRGTLAFTFSNATWYHVEVDRASASNQMYFFVNGSGVTGSPFTFTDSISTSNQVMRAGTGNRNSGGVWSTQIFFNGWLDEIRVSKGIARHTANFTPPTSAYSAAATAFLSRLALMGVG